MCTNGLGELGGRSSHRRPQGAIHDGLRRRLTTSGRPAFDVLPLKIPSLGNGQGAIRNADFSVNGPGNSAAPGSIIQIYGTGEGQTKPAGMDGQFANEPLAISSVEWSR